MVIKKCVVFIIAVCFCALLFRPAAFAGQSQAISGEAFLSSDFVKYFKNKDYSLALTAIDSLAAKYPDDPLVLRYRGFTLEKLGRPKDAIDTYKKILSKNPDYAPVRIFLSRAYSAEQKREEAASELSKVIQSSASAEYRNWAQAQLNRLRLGTKKGGRKAEKKPYFLGKTGIAYDSNPLLVPDNKSLVTTKKKDGARYTLDVDLGYPLALEKDFRLDAIYIGRQAWHDKGVSAVDFTSQGFAVDAKKRRLFGKRAVIFGGRYDFRGNFLRSEYFSMINRFLLGADTSFWKKSRTHFYARLSVLEYNKDGSSPSRSSRDGFRGAAGLTQYFYSSDFKSFIFVKPEFNFNQPRGENFIRRGVLGRIGAHTPINFLPKTDFDISVGYDWGEYPEFSSLSSLDSDGRLDRRLDNYAALTHHLKPSLALRAFYRFIKSDNENGFFDRKRHIAGTEMIFSF
jgi:tetratricopeptide (TPR) repeat protein